MKVAIYGVWHVHADEYTKAAIEHGEVVGVYEANAERRRTFCENYGVPEMTSPNELLESDAEGVIVCCSSDEHADAMVAIANAGKDIFTEKVLALTDEECERVEAAVKENGVRFVISLFQKYMAPQRTLKKLVDSGELGKINFMRFRNCHSGSINDWLPKHFYNKKECGGGAMIDLGAHGMYLIHWFLGMPDMFSSTFTIANENPKNTDGVEDNAVTVMGYKNGAIAINETGFVSCNCPLMMEIGGDAGFARIDGDGVVKQTRETDGKPVAVPLEEELPRPIIQFLTNQIEDGCGMAEAKALTRMMVEAYKQI